MKLLRRLYYKLFPTYRQIELKVLDWDNADKLIKAASVFKEPEQQWHIAKEDCGMSFPMVALERRKRVTE